VVRLALAVQGCGAAVTAFCADMLDVFVVGGFLIVSSAFSILVLLRRLKSPVPLGVFLVSSIDT
jgi:hypothetical protein